MPEKRFAGIIFLSIFSLFLSCNEKIEPGTTVSKSSQVVKAAVAEVKISFHPHRYEAVGTIEARTASILSSKLMGTVKAVKVREGDLVKQGQVLVIIDDRRVIAQLRQARAALAEAQRTEAAAISGRNAAKAAAELAQATYNRYLGLLQEDSVSRQEFDEIKARYQQSGAALKRSDAMVKATRERIRQARAAVSSVQISKKDTRVSAPYSGIITAKMVEVGNLAVPGTPLLTLEKSGGFQVNVVIPETHIRTVKLKQKLMVTLPAMQEQPIEGIVQTIVPASDPQSRSFTVKVRLPGNIAFHSGMFARVTIPLSRDRMILIPISAVVSQGQLTGVYLVESDQIARFRLIRTGRKFDDQIEVISGLREGSRYVVSPPSTLVDGSRVEVAL